MAFELKLKTTTAEEPGGLYEFPCSLAQQRFWLLDQLNPGYSSFNIAVRWRLLGRLDPVLIERAFNAMLQRHEVLRTSFRATEGHPVQVVWPNVSISVPVADVSQLPESEREKEAERITLDVAKKPFDLSDPPLIRATLLKLAPEEHFVLVTVHHIVADGWSIGIMARELGEFYEGFASDRAPLLGELPIQYADFAVWQQDLLQSSALAAPSDYWKQKLRGMQPFEIEPDFPRPTAQTSNGTILSTLLPRELTNALKEFSNRQGVTLYTTALTAFNMLLWHWSRQRDISVGTQVAGRNQVELENLVGVFINTLVLRTEIAGDLSFADLLRRTEATISEAIAHQDMPFEQLVEMLRPKRDMSRGPLFNINFIYQRAFIENRDFAGVSLIDLPSRSPGAIYDLNFFMVERVEGWRWSCEYNTDLFSPETVKRMLASFQGLLEAIVQNPDRHVAEFPIAQPREVSSPATAQNEAPVQGHAQPTRADVERELTKIWEDLLGVSPVSLTADFFELGGHSLLATRMLARVDKLFGKKIPLAKLFETPTIQALTTTLVGNQPVTTVPGVVPVQPKGTRPPIFCLHGIPSMKLLSQQLGTDQPFFMVNLPDDFDMEPAYDVERIAAIHLETIRKVQSQGPYYLAGWCREGLLALEVAQQLRTQGEEVALLTMFDTWIPRYLSRFNPKQALRARWSFEVERVLLHGRKLREMGLGQAIAYSWEHTRQVVSDRLRYARMHVSYRLHTEAHRPSQDEVLFIAVGHYQPKLYPGRVVLFRSDKYRTWKYWDRALGWSHLLPALTVQEIPGYHDSMLTGPHLPVIARALTQAMDESFPAAKSLKTGTKN